MNLRGLVGRNFHHLAVGGAGLVLFGGMAFGQFPDLPGKDLTMKVCSNCHEPDRAASLYQTKH